MQDDQIWEKLSVETKKFGYRNLENRTFRTPDGNTSEWTVIAGQDGASVIALTPDLQVICAEQFRPGPEEVMSEIPGGLVDKNEDPAAAAERELIEETNYKPGSLHFLAKLPIDGYLTMRRNYYLALDCQKLPGNNNPDEHEFITIKTMPISSFIELIYQGKVTDSGGAILAIRELEKRGLYTANA